MSTSCVSVIMPGVFALWCCSLSLSVSPSEDEELYEYNSSEGPLHISGAPGEGSVAFLRGATQTEQSLQESGKNKNKQQTNEMGSRDHVRYIGLEGQFITHCFMLCNIEYNAL